MSKLSRTSTSFYMNNSSPSKINFQTKLKIRGTNEYLQKRIFLQDNLQHEQSNLQVSQYPRNDKSFTCLNTKNTEINKSYNLLSKLNFSHHNSEQCVCNQCSCGRHLCKLHLVKPDLTKSTSYRQSFKKCKKIINDSFLVKQVTKSLPKVQMSSNYAFSFKHKEPNFVIKPHPEDQLKCGGPAQNITMYRINYPGNRGRNPYVRPKQIFVSGQFSLKNKQSAYRKSYNKFEGFKMTQSGKINDQLKTGDEALFRESFYQQKFKSPNPEDYGNIVKNIQKRQINPQYSRQYESSYRNQFVRNESAICPAKVKLQTRYKNQLSCNKDLFAQNSDFKALSSTFHALSTTPYGQYQ